MQNKCKELWQPNMRFIQPAQFVILAYPHDFNGEGYYCKAGLTTAAVSNTWEAPYGKLGKLIANPIELRQALPGQASTTLWVMFDLSNKGGPDLLHRDGTDRGFYVWVFNTREQARAFRRCRSADDAVLSAIYPYCSS